MAPCPSPCASKTMCFDYSSLLHDAQLAKSVNHRPAQRNIANRRMIAEGKEIQKEANQKAKEEAAKANQKAKEEAAMAKQKAKEEAAMAKQKAKEERPQGYGKHLKVDLRKVELPHCLDQEASEIDIAEVH